MSLSGLTTRSKAKQLKKDADEAARVVEAEVDATNQSRISTKSKTTSSSSRLTKTRSRRINDSATTKTSFKRAKFNKAVLQATTTDELQV